MHVRFNLDEDSGRPHFESHGVGFDEVLEILRGPSYQTAGRKGTKVAEGQTIRGRYLRVIFAPGDDGSIFVITAYDLVGKAKAAYRRRRRRRQ